ncbi:ribosomal protein S6 kinase-like 1 [Crotalus adamanteus]|uniref:Ribosomal protein S6 kinase-like 1 n=1 Tax=Crotalus adamanteus TaxID=8729 RepID=A0AAW1C7C8_CROAD
MDSESCNRAFSQARVYLEQIRSRVAPGSIDIHGPGKRDYLVDAAKQIRLALERDVSEDYEEAFNHYKNGVDVLLSGVQVDPNKERREAVKRKITQYLKRAEEIFNCHLQCNLGNGNSTETGYSSLRFRPIRTLSTPVENLKRCKVVGIIDKVQIVQDPATGDTFILKSIPKSHVETRQRQTIIPHGIPFMTELLRYSVSKDSIFLHLEHVKGGNLWSYLRSHHGSASVRSPLLSSKLTSDFGYIREEEHIESFYETGSDSQQSCNIYPENNNGPMPGILCQDLNPRNLLLDDTGHLRLTFFGQWCEVEPQYSSQAVDDLYCAPEVGGISELTEACDWWSFGALLYELLNGVSLSQNHPSGIHPYTQIYLPEKLSQSASSLLSELLQYDPKQRLGSGEKALVAADDNTD